MIHRFGAGRTGGKLAALALFAAMFLTLLAPGLSHARDRDGGGGGGKASVRKIVTFAGKVDDLQKERLVRGKGGATLKHLRLVNAVAAELPDEAAAADLARQPGVVRVEEDAIAWADGQPVQVQGRGAKVQPAQSVPWGVAKIGADRVSASNNAVEVAVLDTGIQLDHPDLSANIAGSYNAIRPGASATDKNGHGTHVAGTVAALNNAIGVVGVAPAVRLYAVKVLGDSGYGYVSDIIEGIDWAIGHGAEVINMSLGTSVDVQALHDAVIRAFDAGVTVVAAAGNSGPADNTVNYPARYPEVIAVAATDQNDALASFSSRGPEVDVAAPGVSILSTYKGSWYATLSGTSMATPHVAGTAALVRAQWGAVSPAGVRQHLIDTADATTSYPRVNAYNAVTQAPATP